MSAKWMIVVAVVVGLIVGAIVAVMLTRNAILGGPRTPGPTVPITDPTDPAQRNAVLAYARTLTFAYDKGHRTEVRRFYGGDPDSGKSDPYGPKGEYHGQFDENLLDTFGDSGIVVPEINIHRSRASDLREGRVQLKIVIVPGPGRAAKDVFAATGFYPGTSYLWVDRLNSKGDSARSVIVPEDPTMPIEVRSIGVYPTPQWNLAVARWTPGTCWSCESEGWCH